MRILLATDGSSSSTVARDLVASLPWEPGTRITLISAYELPPPWLVEETMATAQLFAVGESALRSDTEERLAAFAVPLEGHGWRIDRVAALGRAGAAILAAAEEISADVIVLGSRGHGRIASMLLGSVSAEVADRAKCSVLVARHPRVSRMLVTTDGSPCSSVIPQVLGEWQALGGTDALALSVTPVDSLAFAAMVKLYTLGDYPLETEQGELRKAFKKHAHELADQLSAVGIAATPDTREGDAAHEIIGYADEHSCDLVVTGSHCLHGLDRWILGSVARDVLVHTGASVLIVRRRDEQVSS